MCTDKNTNNNITFHYAENTAGHTNLCSGYEDSCKHDIACICCGGTVTSIDISHPWSAQQSTHRMLLQQTIEGTDRQTDGHLTVT